MTEKRKKTITCEINLYENIMIDHEWFLNLIDFDGDNLHARCVQIISNKYLTNNKFEFKVKDLFSISVPGSVWTVNPALRT